VVKIIIKMAPDADYQDLAMQAAEGEPDGDQAAGKVTRRRHPAEEARELFELRNYPAALEKFNAALAESGGDEDSNLHFAIARTQYELGQYDAAAATLRRVQELEKTPRPGLFYYQAMLASKAGRSQEALDYLQREIDAGGPNQAAMLATKGSLLRDLGQEAEAIAALEKAVVLDPANMNSLLTLGTLHAKTGNQAKAESFFEKAVEAGASKGQEGAVVFFNLGALNYNQKEFRTAAEAFERAVSLRPKYAAAHRELGYTYYDLGEYRKAVEHFQTYLDLQPKAGDREVVEAKITFAKTQG
jgi:tetratricopeptide (TPR) repeat protein